VGVLLCLAALGCASVRAATPAATVTPAAPVVQTGVASWYGPGFHGKPTASGEPYDQRAMTAAHRTLPLGTRIRVTNLGNGRSAEFRINDRGPFVGDRILDVSRAGAEALAMVGPGTAEVRVEVLAAPVALSAIPTSLAFTVQAGSFSRADNAESLRQRLAPAYADARVEQVVVRGTTLYRVYVGRFETREAADEAARRLVRDGFSALVVER
jgi:rare lipoprotein A